MYELKEDAARFFAKNRVPEKLEKVLNSLFYEKPEDVFGRLSCHFEAMALAARISNIDASPVMDSTGNPAIQCRLHCTVRNEDKLLSSTSLSVEPEIPLLPLPPPDSEEKPPSKESVVPSCLEFISSTLSDKLKGCHPTDQRAVDTIIRKFIDDEEDKHKPPPKPEEEQRTPTPASGAKKKPPSGKGKGKATDKPIVPYEPHDFRLQGCSAVSVTSIAVLEAAASFLKKSTCEHLHDITGKDSSTITFPAPSINIISAGKSSPGKLNIAKNVFLIAKPGLTMEKSVGKLTELFHQVRKIFESKSPNLPALSASGGLQFNFEKIEQPLDIIQEAATAAGLTLGQDIFIGIECAANEVFDYGKGKYEIMTGALKSADEIIDYYKDITSRYASIIMLVDPLRKEDKEQWMKLCETISEKTFITGSQAFYGSMHCLDATALENHRSSGIAFYPGGRVTVSDIIDAFSAVKEKNGITMMISPPGDVCNTLFTDLAVGLDCDIVRFGSPARGENSDRLNRLVEIERLLDGNKIGYRKKFSFPLVKPPTPIPTEDDLVCAYTPSPPESRRKKRT